MSGDAKTILIVEDEPDVREALREVIELEGYAVAEAENGLEALEYLRSHPAPSLVVLDLMMPVMNGLDFLEAVRTDLALRSVSVLIVSAAARDKLEDTVRRTGAAGYLTKPVQLVPLIETVNKLCSERPRGAVGHGGRGTVL